MEDARIISEKQILAGLGFNERLAYWITQKVGTMGMAYSLIGIYVLWIALNYFLGANAFDKPPNFLLLLFISNAIQLWWLPILSVGQNVSSRVQMLQLVQDVLVNEEEEQKIDEVKRSLDALHARLDNLLPRVTPVGEPT